MREFDIAAHRGLSLRVCAWHEDTEGRPPVVLLHGYLEQGAAWDRVARGLSARVLAPDHRGHGLSDHVGAGGFYHFWDYVGDLDAVVRSLGEPIDLVGHSMGGSVACLFAGTRPTAVRRLVLVEGLGPPDLVPLAVPRSRQYLDALASPPTHHPMPDLTAATARMTRHNKALSPDEAIRLATRLTRPHPDGGLVWTWDPLHRATSPVPFDPRIFLHWVRNITAPVLYIDGGRSPFRPSDLASRLEAVPNLTTHTIEDAGHLVHHDAPVALAHAIEGWFGGSP